ncbi:MAG: sugar ABC transporter substrate-binding protein [Eubacteriales bacterium]|nr:sugar ABC transporter substrate-binding protein [Eubacteriales bacterium]
MKKKTIAAVLSTVMLCTLPAGLVLAEENSPEEPAKITFLTWKRSELGEENFDKVMEAFHDAHPEVEVEVQDMPYDQVHDKILTLSASGQMPDVIPVNSPWYLEFASNEIIIPIDEYYEKMDDKFKTDIEGPLWTEYEGAHYALPFDSGTIALFYNKQILSDAGIEPPSTWDELYDAAVKVTDPEKGIYAFTGNMETEPATCITYEVWPYMLQAGAQLTDGNKAAFNTDAGAEGLEFYKKLLDAKVMTPGELSAGEEEKRANFSAGNIAFMIEGPWGVGIQKTANPDLEFGVVPMPAGKQEATTASGGCMGISSNCENPQAAWTFISWLSGEEGQTQLADIGIFPPNKSVLNSSLIQDDEYMKVFAEAYNGIAVNPDLGMPQSDQLRKEFTIQVQEFITGNKTAEEALADAAASWDQAFEELGK